MSRVLVCIIAQARAADLTWTSFRENVLAPLRADLCLCVGESDENNNQNPYWQQARYRWVNREFEDYADAFDEVVERNFPSRIQEDWRQLLKIPYQWLGGIRGPDAHPGPSAILLYYRWVLLQKLKAEGLLQRYDWFVITRSDFVWCVPHPPVERFSGRGLVLPYGEHYCGYTDRHLLVPARHVERSLSMLGYLLADPRRIRAALSFDRRWNLEKILMFFYRERPALGVEYFAYGMYSVRSEKIRTTWSAGEFDTQHGYFVKYPSERRRAERVKKWLGCERSWYGWRGALLLNPWILRVLFVNERNFGELYFRVLFSVRRIPALVWVLQATKNALRSLLHRAQNPPE